MRTQTSKVRCISCSIVLAETGDAGLTIRRNSFQATMSGHVHASLVCYRCGRLTSVTISTLPPGAPQAA